MQLNSPCQDFGFIRPFVVIDSTSVFKFRNNDGSCSELAPGLMFDNFLHIPDAKSLPFYTSVLKSISMRQTSLPPHEVLSTE